METTSIVLNADTRKGYRNTAMSVGEFEDGQPNGVRSMDFLIEGAKNKINFFRGKNIQFIMAIDEHEPIPDKLFMEIVDLVKSCGNNSQVVCRPHDRTQYRWNDKIYLEALKLAEGDYICHFDADCNAYRSDESDIVDAYMDLLEDGYKYICCPVMPQFKHEWYHASTQFFICKRETLNFDEIEKNLYSTMVNGKYVACLEHLLGALAGEGNVLYPPRTDSEYIIFCWWKYEGGLLKKLNEMEYKDVIDFVSKCGLTSTSF